MSSSSVICVSYIILNIHNTDKPGTPRGPIIPTDMTSDSVTLEWHPPADDGGGEITGVWFTYKCVDSFTGVLIYLRIH